MHIDKNIEDVYINHVDLVYRYIFLLVHNKEVAEDLTQETFIKVFRNFSQFNGLSNLNTWIIKIAKNTTYDYFKKIDGLILILRIITSLGKQSSPLRENNYKKMKSNYFTKHF